MIKNAKIAEIDFPQIIQVVSGRIDFQKISLPDKEPAVGEFPGDLALQSEATATISSVCVFPQENVQTLRMTRGAQCDPFPVPSCCVLIIPGAEPFFLQISQLN